MLVNHCAKYQHIIEDVILIICLSFLLQSMNNQFVMMICVDRYIFLVVPLMLRNFAKLQKLVEFASILAIAAISLDNSRFKKNISILHDNNGCAASDPQLTAMLDVTMRKL